MEIYSAISDFQAPSVEGSQNILTFDKGDRFEIFDCHKNDSEWWGARSLTSNEVGYVPSKYMQYEERKIGKLLSDNYKSQREESYKKFTDMQNSSDHKSPAEPQTPIPDYEEEDENSQKKRDSYYDFAKKFGKVLTSIKTIEDMYPDVPEPDPDYEVDEVDSSSVVKPSELHIENQNGKAVLIRERNPSLTSDPDTDESELIKPKKLQNPCIESNTRMALHKELLLNYKMGINVLQKPELDKVLEKRKEKQRIQEWEEQKKASKKRTSFEIKLEERKLREDQQDVMKTISEKGEKSDTELAKIQQKILSKTASNPIKS